MSVLDKAWISDINCIFTDEGWLYLAGIKDLFSAKAVAYAMNERMTDNASMESWNS